MLFISLPNFAVKKGDDLNALLLHISIYSQHLFYSIWGKWIPVMVDVRNWHSSFHFPIQFFWKAKNHNANSSMNYILINQSFLFTCLIELVVRVFTYIQILNCFKNFDYGLTDQGKLNISFTILYIKLFDIKTVFFELCPFDRSILNWSIRRTRLLPSELYIQVTMNYKKRFKIKFS